MELPLELKELAEMVTSGKVVLLRDRYPHARRTKQPLAHHTSRIFLFPFGVRPSQKHPIEVFRNGLPQWMGEEVQVLRCGPLYAAVFAQETREGDVVQATYVAAPEGF
jgi:hypothetical protein